MKKIYILTAVLALLTLSLNAQMQARKNVVQSSTEKVDTPPSGYFRVGPSRASTTPVTPPYSNGFNSSNEWNWWETINDNNDSYTWSLYNNEAARIRWNSSIAADDWLVTAPITLQAGKTYKFYIKTKGETSSYTERLEVKLASVNTAAALSSGTEIIPVTNVNYTSYQTLSNENVTVSTSGNYYFGIHAISAADQYYLYVDDFVIEVGADPIHDLSVALSAPATANAGNTVTVTATVTNTGAYAENGYTVTFSDGTNTFSTQNGTSLAVGASETFTAQYPTNVNDAGQTVNFTATVTCSGDAEATNDNATASTSLIILPPPENVAATASNQSGTMTWDAPSNLPTVAQSVTESFENGTNGWTSIDADGDGYNWVLHNNSTESSNMITNTGSCVMYSESYHNNESGSGGTILYPNNWLISPEAILDGTLSLYACGQDANGYHNEVFGVYVCVGSYNGISDFQQVDADITTTHTMTQYTYDLSQYQGQVGHIAIVHHNVSDQFILNIDDISFIANVTLEPVSYNVYLDGQLVDNVPSTTFSYTFNNVSEGEHQCAVSAVYALGESATVPATFVTQPKTAAPTIAATDNGDGTYTITATSADPTATVILTVGNEQPVTGTGSASYIIAQGNTAQTVTATATAQAPDELVSDPATQNITIPALPKTPTPTITYQVVGNNMVITATGQGTVNLSVTGGYSDSGEGTASVTIPLGLEEQTVTATATAQLPNYQESDPATQPITLPEAGRSPQPTITFTDNGDGSYTITVTGTGEVAVYIDDAEHAGAPIATADNSFSFNVEQHSQAMSITVSATNQEEGLAVSRPVTETYPIPAMTIGDDFQELVPQPANASTPIDMKSLMFVDRFSKVIPNENNHPRLYEYTLEETQVRQRSSNSIPVEVKHTGSDGLGFYSLNQIDNDTVRTLKMDVRNAATDIPLEADPKVYYYTVQRSTAAYPDQADRKWLGVLQRTSDGDYYENLTSAYDYGHEPYPGGQHHIHLDTDTILGEYNQYLVYVPVVWTMGFDRVLYETDHIHNSYGAPKWKTGVGDVMLNTVDVELQDSPSATWNDGKDINMYIMTLDATGYMPTVNTMPYEPYMFRVFVESKNGKLRNWKWVPEDTVNLPHTGSHFEAAPGTTTGPICVWSEYVKDSVNVTFNGNEIYFVKDKVEQYDTTGHWTAPGLANILFAAEANMETTGEGDNERIIDDDLKIFVRFYYIVKGSADGHTPVVHGQRPRDGEGDAPAGYGSESPGTPPSPSTGVKEVQYYGDVVSTTYYNVQGMMSDKPFDGINIVVVRYSNGTTRAFKVVR